MNEQSGSRWEPADDNNDAVAVPRTMPTKTKVLVATAAGVFLMGVGAGGFALGHHVASDPDELVPASFGFPDGHGNGSVPPGTDS